MISASAETSMIFYPIYQHFNLTYSYLFSFITSLLSFYIFLFGVYRKKKKKKKK